MTAFASKSENGLKDVSTHFAFGENWKRYSALIDENRIRDAANELKRLLGVDALQGRSFLDIGCGSGLHSLAALRLGAGRVVGIDIDPESVATTRSVIERFAPGADFRALEASVFGLHDAALGRFDYVYSWGVLHHTGAMWDAIECAADAVNENGRLALALYRKTPLCGVWRVEKRLYKSSPAVVQATLRGAYSAAVSAVRYVLNGGAGKQRRGMEHATDLHDWMGGYPYESVASKELVEFLRKRGFTLQKAFLRPRKTFVDRLVIGCDEWVFARR
ncbi:class I SAM-dependent methyltransferase [Arvimicrobium flavum]|uniref:class I SAM-dependent methyltransferase n=1 Tax=Arvimicrobium flavum TaxID=3393320 RepID=UPI00237A67FD|nr:methyltransferase domain-containing protein [Mesorhizobium shangrilense]